MDLYFNYRIDLIHSLIFGILQKFFMSQKPFVNVKLNRDLTTQINILTSDFSQSSLMKNFKARKKTSKMDRYLYLSYLMICKKDK
jgi:hypothetical protein